MNLTVYRVHGQTWQRGTVLFCFCVHLKFSLGGREGRESGREEGKGRKRREGRGGEGGEETKAGKEMAVKDKECGAKETFFKQEGIIKTVKRCRGQIK